ncbi:MAG: hypothetical protein IKX63_06515 [Muribaculaceae bacterium]|nr:hypothetical protein [Muribaculaceae bacterium]
MKRILLSMLVLMTVTSACAQNYDWRKEVGLPTDCNNPVFTQPGRMHKGRVEGAGICMNDGEAYTTPMVGFTSEWHYAPKLHLCDKELEVMPRVMGLYTVNKVSPNNDDPLKFCVRVHHGCGAVVVYRAFHNYRYTNISGENLEQFIAVYDGEGNLTDAMMMGYEGDLCDFLGVEPHKDYKVPRNMGNHTLEFDKTGEHFTIYRYTYLRDKAEGVPDKVEMRRYYSITPEGKIRLDKITDNSENSDDKSSIKSGASISDVANPNAMEMMELMLTPMSDPQLLPRLDEVWDKLQNDNLVGERVMHLGMMMYHRNPKAFLEYAYKNRDKTSLFSLLKRAIAYKGTGQEYEYGITKTIEESSLDEKKIIWFMKKINGK